MVFFTSVTLNSGGGSGRDHLLLIGLATRLELLRLELAEHEEGGGRQEDDGLRLETIASLECPPLPPPQNIKGQNKKDKNGGHDDDDDDDGDDGRADPAAAADSTRDFHISCGAISPAGDTVAVGDSQKRIFIWRLSGTDGGDGRTPNLILQSVELLRRRPVKLAFHPDGHSLLVGDTGGSLYVLSRDAHGLYPDRNCIHSGSSILMDFVAAKDSLIVCHRDEKIFIYAYPDNYRVEDILVGHMDYVAAVVRLDMNAAELLGHGGSAGGGGVAGHTPNYIISGSGDGTLRMWSPAERLLDGGTAPLDRTQSGFAYDQVLCHRIRRTYDDPSAAAENDTRPRVKAMKLFSISETKYLGGGGSVSLATDGVAADMMMADTVHYYHILVVSFFDLAELHTYNVALPDTASGVTGNGTGHQATPSIYQCGVFHCDEGVPIDFELFQFPAATSHSYMWVVMFNVATGRATLRCWKLEKLSIKLEATQLTRTSSASATVRTTAINRFVESMMAEEEFHRAAALKFQSEASLFEILRKRTDPSERPHGKRSHSPSSPLLGEDEKHRRTGRVPSH